MQEVNNYNHYLELLKPPHNKQKAKSNAQHMITDTHNYTFTNV